MAVFRVKRIIPGTKLLILFVSLSIFLVCFALLVLTTLFSSNFAKGATADSDFEVRVAEILELRVSTCNSSDNSQVVVDIEPSVGGTFKSNCQDVFVNTNNPGYSLTAKATASNPNYNSGAITNNMLYITPSTITPTPTITVTSNTIASPNILSNDTWGFAVEGLNSTDTPSNQARINPSFDSTYTIDNASNTYANLPVADTTIYSTTSFPMPVTSHRFYYATKLTPSTMAGAYATTITYTAIGNSVPELEGFWHTEGRDIIDPYGETTLLKGFNVQNNATFWYDNYYPDLRLLDVSLNEFTLNEMNLLGVNAIRFNLGARIFADYCTTPSCLSYDNKGAVFEIIDEVLTIAKKYGIGIILNMHYPYGSLKGTDTAPNANNWTVFSDENIAKTTQLWVDIADYYKDDNRVLGYDIMNEPTVAIYDGENINDAVVRWDNVAQGMIDAIRQVDDNHIIFVEKMNHGLQNNGNTRVDNPSNYIFPSVSDPNNNLVLQFHDYGRWSYVVQSDERIENDPWVWPNNRFVGVIPTNNVSPTINQTQHTISPWTQYVVPSNTVDTGWIDVSLCNNTPCSIPGRTPEYNLASVYISTQGTTLNSDSEFYFDSVIVEEYDSNDSFLGIVYEESYQYSGVYPSNSNGIVDMNQANCNDNKGGCYKIFGPTSGDVNIMKSWQDLLYFRIDSNNKYKVSAKIRGTNVPAGSTARVFLVVYYGRDDQATPNNKTYLNEMLQHYVKYSEDNNIPIYNGEYGVLKEGAVWDKIGGEQFVADSMEAYKENNIHATYYNYYEKNSNSTERRPGLRVREYNVSGLEPVAASNTTLNTSLYNVFVNQL